MHSAMAEAGGDSLPATPEYSVAAASRGLGAGASRHPVMATHSAAMPQRGCPASSDRRQHPAAIVCAGA